MTFAPCTCTWPSFLIFFVLCPCRKVLCLHVYGVQQRCPRRGSHAVISCKYPFFLRDLPVLFSPPQSPVFVVHGSLTWWPLVKELGGQVIDSAFFNPRCTHVVMAQPTRTEKCLSACAAGIWYGLPSVSLLELTLCSGCSNAPTWTSASRRKRLWMKASTYGTKAM